MPAQLVENIQYFGSGGLPLVGGQIFIGTVGLEPVGNLITIFADEDQTTTLPNPQTIGVDGFSENKIFIPGKYSLRVNDVLGAQFLLDLNVGASPGTGTTSLTSVLGTNAITAEGEAAVVTDLIDKEVYTLKIANTNDGTSGVTLQIDSTPVKSIVKNFDQAIDPGDFTQNQIIRVQFNATSDNYAWVDASVKTKRQTKGSDIASASSITIPNNDGNVFDITGSLTIATINGVPGSEYTFQMDGAVTFTNSASLIISGGADYTSVAGDVVKFYQLTSSTGFFTNTELIDRARTLARSLSTVTVVSSTTETSIFSFTVPANALGTNRLIRTHISGTYLINAGGSQSLTIKSKFGSTPVATGVFNNSVNDATPIAFTLDVYLCGDDSASAQKGWFVFSLGASPVNAQFQITGYGTAAETSSGSLTFDVTITHSVNSATLSFDKEAAFARIE